MKLRVFKFNNVSDIVTDTRLTGSDIIENIALPRLGSNELLLVRSLSMTIVITGQGTMTVSGIVLEAFRPVVEHFQKLIDEQNARLDNH